MLNVPLDISGLGRAVVWRSPRECDWPSTPGCTHGPALLALGGVAKCGPCTELWLSEWLFTESGDRPPTACHYSVHLSLHCVVSRGRKHVEYCGLCMRDLENISISAGLPRAEIVLEKHPLSGLSYGSEWEGAVSRRMNWKSSYPTPWKMSLCEDSESSAPSGTHSMGGLHVGEDMDQTVTTLPP